jgi:muramoyltetrapeptide carboxypeptidase LdcA involved in peptidoglycan recycling
MRYPKFLNPGDEISFVATSFGATLEPYNKRVLAAKRKFSKLGYKVNILDNVNKADLGYLATYPYDMAEEFSNAYLNSDSKLLLSVGGGELQFETLAYLDFDKLKDSEPKWFDGFSDNTNYSFLFPTLMDVAAIYGHCAGSFGMYNWHQSILDDYNLFTGNNLSVSGYGKFALKSSAHNKKHPLSGYNLKYNTKITSYPSDELNFEGRLLGGCLDILSLICGTKYDKVKEFNNKYASDGVVWFLEACDLTPVAIRRVLIQLRDAGWFSNAKGFLIGRSANAFNNSDFGLDRISACDVLKELNVPILIDIDLGHIPPTMPIICGSYGKVEYKENNLKIEMELK